MIDDSLELFHKHIQSVRYKLYLTGQSENNYRAQEINLAIEQLNSYETIINQQFQLLMSIDPLVDNSVVNSVIIKINGIVTEFAQSLSKNKEPNKFINCLPINNYTI